MRIGVHKQSQSSVPPRLLPTDFTPTMLTALLPLLSLSLTTASASASTVPAKRWTQSQADCWSFNADVYAETAQTIDLASVIG